MWRLCLDLVAAEAEEIAELMQQSLFVPLIEQWHPGQPVLAKFAKNLHRDCGIPWNQGKKLFCAVAAHVGECFAGAYKSESQSVRKGAKHRKKNEIWHFYTRVNFPGATAPVEANITEGRFGDESIPQIYSVILQKKGYSR